MPFSGTKFDDLLQLLSESNSFPMGYREVDIGAHHAYSENNFLSSLDLGLFDLFHSGLDSLLYIRFTVVQILKLAPVLRWFQNVNLGGWTTWMSSKISSAQTQPL